MLFLMKERFRHHLHPETQKALKLAHRLSGKASLFKRVDDLPHNTRAVLRRPPVPNRPYEIAYRKGEERILDYLITHEVGQIVRLFLVPEAERLAPFISPENRRYAAEQLAASDEFIPLLADGLAPEIIGDMMQDWHEALAEQLANGPVDLRIEQWIFDRFSGPRQIQEHSLIEEVCRGYDALHSLVRQTVPATIYWPTVAMNAAQAWHVAGLFDREDILGPYNLQQLTGIGEDLAKMVLDRPDEGHKSDMDATNRWAEEMQLTGWFEWERFPGRR